MVFTWYIAATPGTIARQDPSGSKLEVPHFLINEVAVYSVMKLPLVSRESITVSLDTKPQFLTALVSSRVGIFLNPAHIRVTRNDTKSSVLHLYITNLDHRNVWQYSCGYISLRLTVISRLPVSGHNRLYLKRVKHLMSECIHSMNE